MTGSRIKPVRVPKAVKAWWKRAVERQKRKYQVEASSLKGKRLDDWKAY